MNCFYTRKPVNLQGKRWQNFDYALLHAGVDEIGENQHDGPPLDLKMAGRMFEMLNDDFDNTQDNDNDGDYEDEDQEEQKEELTQPKRKKSVINFNTFFPASMLFFMMYCPYGEAAYNFEMTNCLTMDTKAIDMAAKRNRNLNAKSLKVSERNENDQERYVPLLLNVFQQIKA